MSFQHSKAISPISLRLGRYLESSRFGKQSRQQKYSSVQDGISKEMFPRLPSLAMSRTSHSSCGWNKITYHLHGAE